MFKTFGEAAAEFDALAGTRPADPESFFAVEPIFREVLDGRLYVQQMNQILRSVLDRATRTNALLTAGTFVSLHSSEQSTWIVMEHRRKSQFLYMTPVHSIQSPISGVGYTVDYYKTDGETSFETVPKKTRIKYDRQERVEPMAIAKKAGNGEILDILSIAGDERCFSLRTSSMPVSDFQINFDRETLSLFGLTPVNPMLSNLTTIFDLLADVASPDSIDCLRRFAAHDQHFIRWRAVRSVFAIDQDVGRELIEEARSDPHEQVRDAAERTLLHI
jgi:hypothetical protein